MSDVTVLDLRGDFLKHVWEHDGRTVEDRCTFTIDGNTSEGKLCDCRACMHNRRLKSSVASLPKPLQEQRELAIA